MYLLEYQSFEMNHLVLEGVVRTRKYSQSYLSVWVSLSLFIKFIVSIFCYVSILSGCVCVCGVCGVCVCVCV